VASKAVPARPASKASVNPRFSAGKVTARAEVVGWWESGCAEVSEVCVHEGKWPRASYAAVGS